MNTTAMNTTVMTPMLRFLSAAGLACALAATAATARAQAPADDGEALRMAAVDALISAPPERALPLARKVVEGPYGDELKMRALFVLSQIDDPEAQAVIVRAAHSGEGPLRYDAIRMIGIGGDPEALAQLAALYADGDDAVQNAVLEAYLIADDEDAVYRLAVEATNEHQFRRAVQGLAAMGADDQLCALRGQVTLSGSGVNEALIEAYAVAGDFESLVQLAREADDPEQQARAIEALGIVDDDAVVATLREIYRSTDDRRVREAALNGMMMADDEEGMLALFRESEDPVEKRRLLEYLVMTDSDAVWDLIDQALEEGK